MIDEVKVLRAIQNCVNVPKCRDCPWEECEQEHETVKVPKSLLMDAFDLIRMKNGRIWTLLNQVEDLQNQLLGSIDDGR